LIPAARTLLVVLAIEAVAAAALLAVALDLRAHRRVEQLGGVNIWGYRGSVLPRKQPDEKRIAVIGGDFAFGWGQSAGGTVASEVRRLVMLETDRPGGALHPITAVNLSAQGMTPGEYGAWIDRFAYLEPDVICIVADPVGYVSKRVRPVPDRKSAVFALFGYAPILPLVLEEKGALAHSRVLSAIGRALAAADHGLSSLVGRTSPGVSASYADALEADVRAGLRAGAAVVLVLPPYRRADARAHHEGVAARVATVFGWDRHVRYLDLGDHSDLYDATLRLNDFDFASAGIARMAQAIAPPVTQLVRARLE
jgi:hypothetical protein